MIERLAFNLGAHAWARATRPRQQAVVSREESPRTQTSAMAAAPIRSVCQRALRFLRSSALPRAFSSRSSSSWLRAGSRRRASSPCSER